jgi:hypothetical protein
LKEGGRLVPVKLGALSKPMGLEPMWYDARVLAKEAKDAKARNNTTDLLLRYLGSILINFLH